MIILIFCFLVPGSKAWFSDPKAREYVGLVNATLQSAYFMLAARALGLDCCGMAGFNQGMVNDLFLKEQGFKSIFLCNLGYGDRTNMPPRGPRLTFDQACAVV
jgi:3-hydroxypropanoate dehydrogenase